jgi:hypothetical protein
VRVTTDRVGGALRRCVCAAGACIASAGLAACGDETSSAETTNVTDVAIDTTAASSPTDGAVVTTRPGSAVTTVPRAASTTASVLSSTVPLPASSTPPVTTIVESAGPTVTTRSTTGTRVEPAPTGQGVPTSTTTTTTTATTTTTSPVPSTVRARGTEAIRIRLPGGAERTIRADAAFDVTATSFVFDIAPVAVSTGLPAQLASVGPAEVCSNDNSTDVLIHGGAPIGATCVARVRAPAAGELTAADYRVSFTVAPAGVISWTYVSGPPQLACLEPGRAVPDLVIRPTADSDPLAYRVDMLDPSVELPPDADPALASTISIELDLGADGNSPIGRFTIGPDAPPGARISFTIGYVSRGPTVFVTDEPDRFEWRIELPCA